jgi:hypothetical protein
MGPNSLAKIPVAGKVNSFKEVMYNTYATAFDALNLILLSKEYPGLTVNDRLFKLKGIRSDPTLQTLARFRVVEDSYFNMVLRGRFYILKNLTYKILDLNARKTAYNKVEAIEALTYYLLKTYPIPLERRADLILKRSMADVISPQAMQMIDQHVLQAEANLIRQMQMRLSGY